jgi:tetratricopeptide (TPR) repeat protein
MNKLLALTCAALLVAYRVHAETLDGYVWETPNLGVGLATLPLTWKIDAAANKSQSVTFTKHFEGGGIKVDEHITLQVTRDTSSSLDQAIKTLQDDGYDLVDQGRVGIMKTVPFWLMTIPVMNPEESAWLAIILHGGKAYSLCLQCTQLDSNAQEEFHQVVEGFRLIPNPREKAWSGYSAGDYKNAKVAFRKILKVNAEDADAIYGLGLTELALHDVKPAIADLGKAASALKGEEDVRRALGRAEFEGGHIARAVTMWVQVIRENPAWEQALRPYTLQALKAATNQPRNMHPSNATKDLSTHLAVVAKTFLARLSYGDELTLVGLQDEFRQNEEDLIDSCLAGNGTVSDLKILCTTPDLEKGIRQGIAGVHDDDDDDTYEAQYTIAEEIQKIDN